VQPHPNVAGLDGGDRDWFQEFLVDENASNENGHQVIASPDEETRWQRRQQGCRTPNAATWAQSVCFT